MDLQIPSKSSFTDLPNEILYNIIKNLGIFDQVSLKRVSKRFSDFIKNSDLLLNPRCPECKTKFLRWRKFKSQYALVISKCLSSACKQRRKKEKEEKEQLTEQLKKLSSEEKIKRKKEEEIRQKENRIKTIQRYLKLNPSGFGYRFCPEEEKEEIIWILYYVKYSHCLECERVIKKDIILGRNDTKNFDKFRLAYRLCDLCERNKVIAMNKNPNLELSHQGRKLYATITCKCGKQVHDVFSKKVMSFQELYKFPEIDLEEIKKNLENLKDQYIEKSERFKACFENKSLYFLRCSWDCLKKDMEKFGKMGRKFMLVFSYMHRYIWKLSQIRFVCRCEEKAKIFVNDLMKDLKEQRMMIFPSCLYCMPHSTKYVIANTGCGYSAIERERNYKLPKPPNVDNRYEIDSFVDFKKIFKEGEEREKNKEEKGKKKK